MQTTALNEKAKELYNKYIEVLENCDVESALETGLALMEMLLEAAKTRVLASLSNPSVKEIAYYIISQYEKETSFVKGAREATRTLSPLYATEVLDKALNNLSLSINGLLNFIVGALIMLADIEVNLSGLRC